MSEIGDKIRTGMGRRREPGTVDAYVQIAEQFSRFTKKDHGWTRDNLLAYVDDLIDKKYRSPTLRHKFYALKKVFGILGEPFDLTVEDLPRGRDKANQPAIKMQDLIHLIQVTKEQGNILEKFYLAMATTFVLRREELSRLDDSMLRESGVFIPRAKHNDQREYVMPEEIRPYYEAVIGQGIIPNSVGLVSLLWHSICERAGYNPVDRESWHSVRRAMDTFFLNAGIQEVIISKFIGWSTGSSGMMVRKYYQADNDVIDKTIFDVHPLIEYWA